MKHQSEKEHGRLDFIKVSQNKNGGLIAQCNNIGDKKSNVEKKKKVGHPF